MIPPPTRLRTNHIVVWYAEMAMNGISNLLTLPEVAILRRRAAERNTPLYLVGGAVRDLLAGRPAFDYDFAVAHGGEDLPWSAVHEMGGSCFWLDRQRGQCRIVLKKLPGMLTLDFAPLQGEGIETDLAARDFTVNACAIELTAGKPMLIDPLSGVTDLRDGVLRSCSTTTFPDDPLRLLRAFRLAAAFGLRIEPGTCNAIAAHARLISQVAPERIRDELFKILTGPKAAAAFRDMHSFGLLTYLFPHCVNSEKALIAMDRMEQACSVPKRWLPENGVHLAEYLGQEIEGCVTIASLLKLASFVDSTGEAVDQIGDRLRLGRKAVRCLRRLLVGLDEQVRSLGDTPSFRAMYRLFRDQDAGPEIVVFSLVCHGLSANLASLLLSFYFTQYSELEELVTGRDIQEQFGVGEGEKVGALLRAVKAAERTGTVVKRAEALDFLRRKLLTKDHS